MGLIPDTKIGKLEFMEQHVTPWTENSVAIGSSAGAITAWSTLVTNTRTAYNAHLAAQIAAKNATENLNAALATALASTRSIINQVHAKADLVGNSVYPLASLPVPATPSPIGELGKPENFTMKLAQSGELSLKWKCNNPRGATSVIYSIWRQLGDADSVMIGASGKREFIDDTIPTGTSKITYEIRATRSTGVGPWAYYVVNLNSGTSGATGKEVSSVKIAA